MVPNHSAFVTHETAKPPRKPAGSWFPTKTSLIVARRRALRGPRLRTETLVPAELYPRDAL